MKILYVEDEIAHLELAQRTLEDNLQDEFVLFHVESIQAAMELMAKEPDIDLILSDLRLPDGSGIELLKKVREMRLPPAVVLVTGQGDQEVAVQALKAGAADYLVKQSDYLHRLPIVVSNAVAQNRLAREQAALREAEIKYQSLVEQTPAVVFLQAIDENGTMLYMNPRVEELSGYTADEWRADNSLWENHVHPDDRERILATGRRSHNRQERFQEEYRFIRRDGRTIWIKEDTNLVRDKNGNPLYWQGIFIDITKEKENQAALQRQLKELTVIHNVTLAGTEGDSENDIIERVVQITAQVYNEVCGVLLLNEKSDLLIPHPSYYGANTEKWQAGFPLSQGITGRSILEGRPVRLGDISQSPEYIEITTGIRSELCVPLRVNKRIIGIFNVESRSSNAFDEEDERFLNTIAGSLGTALERLRLFKEDRQRNKELNILYLATKSLTQSLKPESIAQDLLNIMAELIGYDISAVILVDSDTQLLIPISIKRKGFTDEQHQAELERLRNLNIKTDQGMVGWVIQNNSALRVGDVRKDARYLPVQEGMLSLLSVPLAVRGKVIGALILESPELDAYDEHDESLLTTLAGSAAIALENARLYETERGRREEAEALQEATASLSVHIETKPLLEQILNSLLKIVPYDSASIFLEDRNGDIEIVAAVGFKEEDHILGMKIPRTDKWEELVVTRKPLIMSDAQLDPRFEKWDGTERIRGWMGVPMITQDRVVGFINLDSCKVNAFTERDATLAQTFANSAAVAIQNASLFNTEREQRKREESILQLMRVTTSSLELDEIMQTILKHLLSLIPSESGTLQLLEEGDLRITATQGFEEGALVPGQILSLQDSSIKRKVLETQEPVWINNTRQDKSYNFINGIENVNSFMAVPLVYKGETIGIATLDSHQINRYSAEDAEFAYAIANQASIAIGNARLYQEALRSSERRAVLHRISQDIARFTQDYEQIYKTIHEAAGKLMDCDVFRIAIRNEAAGENIFVYTMEAGARYYLPNEPSNKGLTGKVVDTGTSLILHSEEETGQFPRFGSPKHVQSAVAVPMRIGNKIIGMISAQSYKAASYGTEEQALLEMLAAHAATAIENARLFQEESRRTQIIETLVDIANEIATTQDIIPVLDKITQRALDLLHANHVAIYLLHDDNHTLKVISAQGVHRLELLGHSLKIGEGITGAVVSTSKPEIINDMGGDERRKHVPGTPAEDAQHDTMMSAPLILRGKSIGAINAWRLRSSGLFNQVELNFLTSIANQVSVAIESANLFKETVRHAQESAAIAEVGRDISASLELDVVLNRIASYAMELLRAESSAVYLYDPSEQRLRAFVAWGLDAEQIKSHPLKMGVGILGNIALSKVGEMVNNPLDDPRAVTIKGTDQNPDEHIMGVPVLENYQLTGLVAVWRSGLGNEFKSSDLDFLSNLAHQAATAIKNARLYDESQRRLREMETINRISSSLRITQSQTEMYDILLDETLKLLDAESGSVWVYETSTNMLAQRTARGVATKVSHKRLKPTEGIVGHVFSTGEPYTVSELKQDPKLFDGNREIAREGFGAAGLPIHSTAGILGVLMVHIESSRKLEDHIGLLTTLVEISGNSIHRANLFDQSQEQVHRLTTLRDIDSAIASSTDLRVTLNILTDHAIKHLDVDAVDIMLYHPELQSLTHYCSTGFNTPSPSRPLVRIGEGLAGQVAMRGRINQVLKLQTTDEYKRDPLLASEGFVSYIGVPLIVKGQIKGVFEIFNRTPLSPDDEWMQFMQTLAGQAAIAIDNSHLFDNLQRSNQELTQAYDTTLEGWARALELRDRETEGHTRRVTDLTTRLARFMGVGEEELANIYRGVLLHDIGKMGVPDQILRKTGPLSSDEWVEMRKHPQYAFDLLSPIPYLRHALDIPYCHHEHWDGSGYPRGLKGEQIPMSARIFSVVDIWDALLSDRPYRKAWPREKVYDYLKDISGTLLDPKVVTAFFKMMKEQEDRQGQ